MEERAAEEKEPNRKTGHRVNHEFMMRRIHAIAKNGWRASEDARFWETG